MAVSRALRRLLRVLEIEEEQCRLAMESALGSLKRLEHALTAATARERCGRRLVASSARSDEPTDRLAGLEETRAGRRHAAALAPRIAETKREVAAERQVYLAKRVERSVKRKPSSGKRRPRDAIEAGRRGQRSLDDWFLSRMQRAEMAANLADAPPADMVPPRDNAARKET